MSRFEQAIDLLLKARHFFSPTCEDRSKEFYLVAGDAFLEMGKAFKADGEAFILTGKNERQKKMPHL